MLLTIVIVLLIFTVIVVAHEWGHYITAKKCGVLVHEFAIGMGPLVWSKQVGETLYSIRLLPIGGFCRMEEEVGESTNSRAMASKSPWQKLLIVSAGVIMNFILAWVLFAICAGSEPQGTNIVKSVQLESPAEMAEIQPGDQIVAIDNQQVHISTDLIEYLGDQERNYLLTINRNGETFKVDVPTRILNEKGRPVFGIEFKIEYRYDFLDNLKPTNILTNLQDGFELMVRAIKMVWESLVGLVTGSIGMDQMAGVVGVVDVGNEVWNSGIEHGGVILAILNMISMAGLLSANLGVMNLLPLPALDGGRILFILIEIIRGKPVSAEKENFVHFIGMILLMLLTVFVLYNDVMRLRG